MLRHQGETTEIHGHNIHSVSLLRWQDGVTAPCGLSAATPLAGNGDIH